MSYFLCGYLKYTEGVTGNEIDRLAFDIVDAALDAKLSVHFSPNIAQRVVFEILETAVGPFEDNGFVFLLTASPLKDQSDELLDFHDVGAGLPFWQSTVERLIVWINALARNKGILTADLVFSEGYDASYQSYEI